MNRIILLCTYISLIHAADHQSELLHFFDHIRFSSNAQIDASLVRHPEWLEAKNLAGRTPLIVATTMARKKTVIFLLKKGANTNAHDNLGYSAFHCAMDYAQARPLCGLLVENGSSTACCCPDETPLMHAVTNNLYELTHQLLAKGAPVNHVLSSGITAIDCAIKKGNTEIVTLLLKYGAHYTHKLAHEQYLTPKMLAALKTQPQPALVVGCNPLHYLMNRETRQSIRKKKPQKNLFKK